MGEISIKWKLEQRSPEWLDARIGKVGGSEAIGLSTPARMETLITTKLAEILTGETEKIKVNDAMQRGIDCEDIVCAEWEMDNMGMTLKDCGQILNSDYPYAALSPDGIIMEDNDEAGKIIGGTEIKCPSSKNHIANVLAGEIPKKYLPQVIHYFMIVETMEWLEFMSWDDRCSKSHKVVYRVTREEMQPQIDKAIKNYKTFEEKMIEHLERLEMI